VGRDRFSGENLGRGPKKIENHCFKEFTVSKKINTSLISLVIQKIIGGGGDVSSLSSLINTSL